MAQGITIGEVTNKLQNVNDQAVLPVSSGQNVPQVVEVGALKEHINDSLPTLTNGEIENLLNNSVL